MTTAPGDNAMVETRMAVLETQMETLQEGQRQILARLDSMERGNEARFESMLQRLDTLQQRNDARFESMQQRSDARYDAAQQRNDARADALNSRIDRLFYTMLGLGIAAIGTLIALDRFF